MLVEQQQHLDLAGGEPVGDRVGDRAATSAFADLVEQAAGDGARERGLAVRDPTQELDDPTGRLALEQVAGGARADRGEQVLLGARGGEDHDLRVGRDLAQPRQRAEAVELGHRQVEEDEVGLEALGLDDRLVAVRGFADHVELVLLEQGGERLARERVVVDEQDPFGHDSLIGTGPSADEGRMEGARKDTYTSWLVGLTFIVLSLGAATGFFVANPALQDAYALPEARLVLET